MNRYTIELTGDGARVVEVTGWPAVVAAVAGMIYSDPTDENCAEVVDMLNEGVDGSEGWNGERVLLDFEDGSICVRLKHVVTSRDSEPRASRPWQCTNPNCRTCYAEYVNGCPRCSEGAPGKNWSVRLVVGGGK